MAGSSSVRGDQTIYHTDNICFDGTDRGSPMAADGQLWIGSATSDRANNGGHVRLGTLTAGTGLVVTNGAGSITLSTSGTSVANTITGNDLVPISPVAGNWNIIGSGSLTTSGSGSTLSASLTGLTNHAVLVGAGSATITKIAATANTGAILQNNSGADPSYSTATYPSTTTVSQLLYSSATNTVSGLATANSAVLVTTGAGVPVWSSSLTNGQVILGSTGGPPVAASLTAGAGITITPGAGSLTIAVTTGSTVVETITGDTGGALSPTAGNINILSTTTNGIDTSGSGSTLTVGMATPYADGDFEFRSSVSGATRVLSVTNTSNTASSQAQMTHSVAGTSAGDTWSQYTVGTTRTYAEGIDTSDSQKLKLTTAAAATANPSTATPVWAFTPATGFNYDVSGTSGFGIGLGLDPDTNYALKMTKSADATFGIQIQNSNAGSGAVAGINFVNNTPVAASLTVPSSTFTDANVRDALYINANSVGTLGIVYNATTSGFHRFYADSSSGNLIASLTNTNMTMSRPFVIGTQQIFSTRQTTPSAGTIGEQIRSAVASGSAVSVSTGTNTDITSISLTAGVWDVSTIAMFKGTITGTIFQASISTTSVTGGVKGDNFVETPIPPTAAADNTLTIPSWRLILTSTTTVYLVVAAAYTVGTLTCYGRLSATRVA